MAFTLLGTTASATDLLPSTRGPKLTLTLRLLNQAMGDAHGVKVFLDNQMVYNNDAATGNVFTVTLDLSGAASGDHYVLVNICDHHDHIAATASRILIGGPASGSVQRSVTVETPLGSYTDPGTASGGTSVDFVDSSPYLGCCGRGGDWANGNCGSTGVVVSAK